MERNTAPGWPPPPQGQQPHPPQALPQADRAAIVSEIQANETQNYTELNSVGDLSFNTQAKTMSRQFFGGEDLSGEPQFPHIDDVARLGPGESMQEIVIKPNQRGVHSTTLIGSFKPGVDHYSEGPDQYDPSTQAYGYTKEIEFPNGTKGNFWSRSYLIPPRTGLPDGKVERSSHLYMQSNNGDELHVIEAASIEEGPHRYHRELRSSGHVSDLRDGSASTRTGKGHSDDVRATHHPAYLPAMLLRGPSKGPYPQRPPGLHVGGR